MRIRDIASRSDWRASVPLLLLGIIFFSACGGGGEAPKPAPTATGPTPSATAAPGVTQERVQPAEGTPMVIGVAASFIVPRFQPDPIVLKVGEPVQFKVSSVDVRHTFTVEALGIDVELPQTREPVTTIVVTPERTGTFTIVCRIHARFPMVGTIQVVE